MRRNESVLAVVVLSLLPITTADAQWLNQPTPNLPRTADGRPDLAAPPPRGADGHPDLSGLWVRQGGQQMPMPVPDRALTQRSRDVIREREETYFKDHPAFQCQPTDPERTWMGYSVGRWEGDTLVVDSFGFNDRTWLHTRGLPHTEALRTTERYHRRSMGLVQVELTLTDPGAFDQSWTVTYDLVLQPDTEMLEAVCEDRTHWIGRLSDAERDAVTVSPATLAKYVGVYSGLWGSRPRTVRVQLEGDTLYLNGLVGDKVRLIPHSETSFAGTDGLSFDFDPEGNPAAFMVERHVSGDWKFMRQPQK
jgi:hypothetical protein